VTKKRTGLLRAPIVYRSNLDWLTIYSDLHAGVAYDTGEMESAVGSQTAEKHAKPGQSRWTGENGIVVILREVDETLLAKPWAVEIVVPGYWWCSGGTVDKVCEILSRICGVVGADYWQCVPGRIDLAWDISGEDHSAYCGHGSIDELKKTWKTKTKRQEITGRVISSQSGTTAYLGARSYRQLVVYQKDAEFVGNTRCEELEAQWNAAGRKEGAPVTRIEVRLTREYIREQIWKIENHEYERSIVHEYSGKVFPWFEMRNFLPDLAKRALSEMALVDDNGECKWYSNLYKSFGQCSGLSYQREAETIRARRCAKKALLELAELDSCGLGDYVREASRRVCATGRLSGCVDGEDVRNFLAKVSKKNGNY